jgi:hypothetical protein
VVPPTCGFESLAVSADKNAWSASHLALARFDGQAGTPWHWRLIGDVPVTRPVMVPCAASLLLALHGGHVALAVVPRGPTNNSDLKAGGPAFNHSFAKHANKTAGALACQATCDAQPRCRAWTYVPYGDAPSGPESHERCCLFPRLGCPVDRQGVVSGAKTAGSCSRPPPPPPGPPAPPPPGPPAPPTP